MLVDIDTPTASLIIDLATDEIKDIERGVSTYGGNAENIDVMESLASVVDVLKRARGW